MSSCGSSLKSARRRSQDLYLSTDAELLEDYRGRSLLVFASQWSINFILKRNPGLELAETAQ